MEDQAVLDLEGVEEGMASVGVVDHQVGEEDPHPEDLNTEFWSLVSLTDESN